MQALRPRNFFSRSRLTYPLYLHYAAVGASTGTARSSTYDNISDDACIRSTCDSDDKFPSAGLDRACHFCQRLPDFCRLASAPGRTRDRSRSDLAKLCWQASCTRRRLSFQGAVRKDKLQFFSKNLKCKTSEGVTAIRILGSRLFAGCGSLSASFSRLTWYTSLG